MYASYLLRCLAKYLNTADAILNSDLGIPLRGAAIGNGWIDSRTQYPSYLDYAVKHGLVEENSEVANYT